MKTKLVELHVGHWSHGARAVSAGVFLLALQLPSSAVDAVPLLDAPGPGYREQSARVKEPPAPAKLEPISFMYLFMAPQPSFDGAAPDAPLLLPRGDFKVLSGNEGWNSRVYDNATVIKTGSTFQLHMPRWQDRLLNGPIPDMDEAATPRAEEGEAIRLPIIPEVILPAPKEADAASAPKQPFIEHLPLELRAR